MFTSQPTTPNKDRLIRAMLVIVIGSLLVMSLLIARSAQASAQGQFTGTPQV